MSTSGVETTKQSELRFRAWLTESSADVLLGPHSHQRPLPPPPAHSPTLRYIALVERGLHHEVAVDLPGCSYVPPYEDAILVAEVILKGSTVPDRVAASP